MGRALVVLDTETATLGGPPHLLELGALRVVDGEVVDTFEELVCPRVPVEPGARAIHGIGDEDVRSARTAPEVLADFLAWLGDDWPAAHNAPFDAGVLAFELARAELDPPGAPWLCSLRLARRLVPESSDHRLETLAALLELEDLEHHRALADATACWKVLEECAERLGGGAGAAELLALVGGAPLTLRGAWPRPPRLVPRLRALERACVHGAEVTLLYGEAGPPASLRVTPRLLFDRRGRGYLEGECGASGLLKTYRLDRVQRVLSPS